MDARPSRLEAIIAERVEARRLVAEAAAADALARLRARSVDIRVFGSLARGDFRAHSDVDFLVGGAATRALRVTVETAVAGAMRGSGLPYDIVYLDDLSPEQAAALADG